MLITTAGPLRLGKWSSYDLDEFSSLIVWLKSATAANCRIIAFDPRTVKENSVLSLAFFSYMRKMRM